MVLTVDTSKLKQAGLEALIKNTTDDVLLTDIYNGIDEFRYHKMVVRNQSAGSELIRKIYEKYSKDKEMVRAIFENSKTPEDVIIDILENYHENFGQEYGYIGNDILYNECIGEKVIKLIYDMYNADEIGMDRSTFNDMIEDERTGVDVLQDLLESEPDDEMLCIIARHPKMKIVPVEDIK